MLGKVVPLCYKEYSMEPSDDNSYKFIDKFFQKIVRKNEKIETEMNCGAFVHIIIDPETVVDVEEKEKGPLARFVSSLKFGKKDK